VILRGRKWLEAGEGCIMWSFIKILFGWSDEEDGMVNTNIILFGKHEGKRTLGRRRSRWEYNIRMNLREIWWTSVAWALVNTMMNIRVP